jgi:MFS family permease
MPTQTQDAEAPPPPPRSRGGVFRQRNFRLLWTGQSISYIGNSMSVVSMPLVAVEVLHASVFFVGLLQAAAALPWLIIGFPAGAWSDRLRKRPVLLACNTVAFVAFLSVPLAAWAGLLSVFQLLLVEFAGGVAAVFLTCAYTPFLPILFPEKQERLKVNGRLQASAQLTGVLGPSAGGGIAEFFGPVLGVFANALSFAVAAVCLMAIRVREPAARPRTERKSLRTEIAEGVRFTFRDRYLRTFVIFCALGNFGDAAMEAVWIVFLVRTVGLAAGIAGVMVALMGLGGAAGALLPGWITARAGSARGFLLCLVIGSPFVLLMPLTDRGPRAALFLVGGFVYLMGAIASNVIYTNFLQTYAPRDMLGRIMSVAKLLSRGVTPLGALCGGAIAAVYGTRTAMWAAGVIITLSVGVLLRPLKGLRDFPDMTPAEEPGQLSTAQPDIATSKK